MLLIDANLLIYAYQTNSPHHERARPWLERVLSGDEPVLISLTTLLAFMRIMTDPNMHGQAMDVPTAHRHVSAWLARPNVSVAEPTPAHWSTLLSVATESQARGPMLMDAHLAALAVEHGATLCTSDRGFRRFKGVRTLDPLVDPRVFTDPTDRAPGRGIRAPPDPGRRGRPRG